MHFKLHDKGNKQRSRNMTVMVFYFKMMSFSLTSASIFKRSYFRCFFGKAGFRLDIHKKIRSCCIQHCRWKYQICADSKKVASDTWILNIIQLKTEIWTKALKVWGSLLLSWLQIPWRLWHFAMTNLIGSISLIIRLNGLFVTTHSLPSVGLTLPSLLFFAFCVSSFSITSYQ